MLTQKEIINNYANMICDFIDNSISKYEREDLCARPCLDIMFWDIKKAIKYTQQGYMCKTWWGHRFFKELCQYVADSDEACEDLVEFCEGFNHISTERMETLEFIS